VVLGQDLVPFRRRQRGGAASTPAAGQAAVGAPGPADGDGAEEPGKPRLRLDDAAEARRRRRA
jgi:hypothetical protein